MSKRKKAKSRSYVHRECDGVTVVSGDDYVNLADPLSRVQQTYCVTCEDFDSIDEFHWQDTGETISDYRARLLEELSSLEAFLGGFPGCFFFLAIGLAFGIFGGIALGTTVGTLWGWLGGAFLSFVFAVGAIKVWDIFHNQAKRKMLLVEGDDPRGRSSRRRRR